MWWAYLSPDSSRQCHSVANSTVDRLSGLRQSYHSQHTLHELELGVSPRFTALSIFIQQRLTWQCRKTAPPVWTLRRSRDFSSYGSKQVKTGEHGRKTGSAVAQQATAAQPSLMRTQIQSDLTGHYDKNSTVSQGEARSLWPQCTGSRDLILNFWAPRISRMSEATELKFSVPIDDWGPNENYATVGHMRICVWVTWPTFNFCDPLHIFVTAIVIESNACNVCGAFDAAFAKLLWPLVLADGVVSWSLSGASSSVGVGGYTVDKSARHRPSRRLC